MRNNNLPWIHTTEKRARKEGRLTTQSVWFTKYCPFFVQMHAHILTQLCALLISRGRSLSELSILSPLSHASYVSPSLSAPLLLSFTFKTIYTPLPPVTIAIVTIKFSYHFKWVNSLINDTIHQKSCVFVICDARRIDSHMSIWSSEDSSVH